MSYPFNKGSHHYWDALQASIHSYYFQRASVALDEALVSQWHRLAGHIDRELVFHPFLRQNGTLRLAWQRLYVAGLTMCRATLPTKLQSTGMHHWCMCWVFWRERLDKDRRMVNTNSIQQDGNQSPIRTTT